MGSANRLDKAALRSVRALALAALCGASPTFAADTYTGASLLQDKTLFAAGFVWGVVGAWLAFPGVETQENIDKIGGCLGDGNITSRVMIEAVRNKLAADATLLAKPAEQAVLTTLYEICPVR